MNIELESNGNRITEIAKALSKAQGEFAPILRDKTVTVATRTGGTYKFSYAPLESIMAAIKKPLADNGLALTQTIVRQGETDYARTTLVHASGETLPPVDVPILVREPGPQAYGSGLTYSRRYGITMLLCICADDDDDGNGAEGNKATVTKEPVVFVKPNPAQNASPLARESEVEYISEGQQANFAKAFREALRPELQSKADALRHDWLAHEKFVDEEGKPTSKRIPASGWLKIRDAAIAHAKQL